MFHLTNSPVQFQIAPVDFTKIIVGPFYPSSGYWYFVAQFPISQITITIFDYLLKMGKWWKTNRSGKAWLCAIFAEQRKDDPN